MCLSCKTQQNRESLLRARLRVLLSSENRPQWYKIRLEGNLWGYKLG